MGGQRRDFQERLSDLFASQRHGVPRIVRQGLGKLDPVLYVRRE